MGVDFVIRKIDSIKELKALRRFVYSQPFWYPKYDYWVDKVCIPEIESGFKTAITAFYEGYVVGNIIYQPHRELPRTREIKNLRIHPQLRRRDFAHFLLRQAEEEDKETFDIMMGDTNTKQKGLITFLQWCGYNIIGQEYLYDKENLDVILAKNFSKTDDLLLTRLENNLPIIKLSAGSKKY